MRPSVLNVLFSDVTRLRGVGPAVAKALGRLLSPVRPLGDTELSEGYRPIIRDLLFHKPSGLLDRRAMPDLSTIEQPCVATVIVTVDKHMPSPPGRRAARVPYRVRCSNETGFLEVVFFSPRADYITKSLPVGQQRVLSGRIERSEYGLQMVHPDIIAPVSQLAQVQTIEPVYPQTAGISNRMLVKMVKHALAEAPALEEWIDLALLTERGWTRWLDALRAMHAPQKEEDLAPLHSARQRFAYDELLAGQLALAFIRKARRKNAALKFPPGAALVEQAITALPYTLTAAQHQALEDISADMASGQQMARLLQGDVGSGKTVVALLAMLQAVAGGAQAVLMAPTGIVAAQHAAFTEQALQGLGVKSALLTGQVKGAKRREILERVAAGEINILTGTHAVFQEEVRFARLGLIVVDEQHRFGVSQRLALGEKGRHPHILQMTATPIPRSLAMTLYGDMESSVLPEKPPGRKPVTTRAVPLSRQEEVLAGLERAVKQGDKAYWICPLIEQQDAAEDTKRDLAAAEARYKTFFKHFGKRVGLVHGRMKQDEREAVMAAFAGDGVDILVATTVVEVGVNVPSATIMVIEHAERFGLSQLHQLRGRVGRGEKPSSCILLYDEECGPTARARLKALRETEDGFIIAEEDLKLRGGGDILGTRQTGLPDFHFVDMAAHAELLSVARRDVQHFLATDAKLETPRGQALRTLLYVFGYDRSLQFLRS